MADKFVSTTQGKEEVIIYLTKEEMEILNDIFNMVLLGMCTEDNMLRLIDDILDY